MGQTFNLDSAIARWLRRISLREGLTDDDLQEVESHVLDTVEALVEEGLTEKQAFFRAVRGFGGEADLTRRYRIANWEKVVGDRMARSPILLAHHLKLAARNASKRKGYTAINLFGLSVSIACFLLIALYVGDELSYDRFHRDADRIYRVVVDRSESDGSRSRRILTPGALAGALAREVPEIEQATRLHHSYWGKRLLSNDANDSYYGDGFLYADDSFFDVFSFRFLDGDRKCALDDPYAVVLTESLAKRFFGKVRAIGQTLMLDNSHVLHVSGVIEDVPQESHLRFDFVLSTMGVRPQWATDWSEGQMHTYVKVRPNASMEIVDAKIRHVKEMHYRGEEEVTYATQPLVGVNGIHLSPTVDELAPGGSKQYIEVLSLVAVLVLLVAGINYVNLATARSAVRAREIGVRKVAGAARRTLVIQFLAESVLLAATAGLIGAGLAAGLLPSFGDLMHKDLPLQAFASPTVLGLVGASVLVFGVAAGLYPALYLSAFQPSSVFRKQVAMGRTRLDLRKALVVTQFMLSAFLIIGMIVAQRQMDYLRSAKLGFDRDQIVVIQNFDETPNQDRDFAVRNAFAALPGVLMTGGFVEDVIGVREKLRPGVTMKLKDSDGPPLASMTQLVDGGYLEVLGLEWIEGRNFSQEYPSELRDGVILNETAVRKLGIQGSAIGQTIVTQTGDEKLVIGVVKDFHASSLHHEIAPFMFQYFPRAWRAVAKVSRQDVRATISRIEKTWKQFVPYAPLDYYFLDDAVDRLYRSEQKFEALFSIMSFLALLIACLGLFGLAAFTAERRKREFGVRKALGASIADVVTLLSKDFLILVVIANLVTWPIAYLIMHNWLENFAYHVSIGAREFLSAGIIALLVATLTVSWQAARAATSNPIDSLKVD